MRVGMLLLILLAQEPLAQAEPLFGREDTGLMRERFD